jgi:hypothetical protein
MTPVERAKDLLGSGWLDALEAHLLQGFVFSTPETFLMARPVPRGAEILDPWQAWPREACDAWFVWIGVGRPAHLLAHAPFPLPWIGWNRLGRRWTDNHWWPAEKVSRQVDAAQRPGRLCQR